MAPEKTLTRIWIEVFGICLWASAILPFALPQWLVIYSLMIPFVVPLLIVWGLFTYCQWRNKRFYGSSAWPEAEASAGNGTHQTKV